MGDVAWAPYSSTVFAAVTLDGRCVGDREREHDKKGERDELKVTEKWR